MFVKNFEEFLNKSNLNKKVFEKNFGFIAITAIFSWLAFGLLFKDLFFGLLLALIVFILLITMAFIWPVLKRKNIASLIEKDLPFALSAMAVEIDLNVKFETCIKNIAEGSYGVVSEKFKTVVKEVEEGGASIQEALFNLSERIDSLLLKRSVSQLVAIYEQGGRQGYSLKKLSSEILSRQRAKSKEFSGKLAVFSLLFIAVSAIVPALFQSFIIVGSFFMKLSFSPIQTFLIVVVGFPLIDALVLLFIRSKTPIFLR